MKKLLEYLPVVAVIGIICAVICGVSLHYENKFDTASVKWDKRAEELQSGLNALDQRIVALEKRPRLGVHSYSGMIVTSDQPVDRWRGSSQTGPYTCILGKGVMIMPALEIPSGSTNVHDFFIQCDKVVDAWMSISQSAPYSYMTNCERFWVDKYWNSNGGFNVHVQLKPGVSCKMGFWVQTLEEF
jgi:hypothetical protein